LTALAGEGAGLSLVWRLGAATALIVMAFSMTAPVLAVMLQQAGHGTGAIGAFSMLPFLLIGLLIPLVPRLLTRWGLLRAYRIGAALELAGVVGYAASDRLAAWVLSSVISGVGAALLWNATETLLTQQAPPAMRGRVMGAYQTALGAALALGPFLPALLRLRAREVLWLAAALVTACLVLVLVTRLRAPQAPAFSSGGTWHALAAVPWLAALALAGGVFEAGLSAIGAAYGAATGMDLRTAASVAGAIGIGSFLVQYPVGWAADHLSLRRVCTGAALLLGAASVAVAFAGQAPWLLWVCGWIWGAFGGGLYTLAIIQVAHAFEGRATAGGAAAMITGYTWGGSLGPLASGAVLQAAGLTGLAVLLSLVALGAFTAARRLPAAR
jgi:MFS family permease